MILRYSDKKSLVEILFTSKHSKNIISIKILEDMTIISI